MNTIPIHSTAYPTWHAPIITFVAVMLLGLLAVGGMELYDARTRRRESSNSERDFYDRERSTLGDVFAMLAMIVALALVPAILVGMLTSGTDDPVGYPEDHTPGHIAVDQDTSWPHRTVYYVTETDANAVLKSSYDLTPKTHSDGAFDYSTLKDASGTTHTDCTVKIHPSNNHRDAKIDDVRCLDTAAKVFEPKHRGTDRK